MLNSIDTIRKYYTKGIEPNITSNIRQYNEEKIEIYPNPIKNKFHIKGLKNNTLIYIHDYTGKIIFSTTANNECEIDLSGMKQGIYLINCPSLNCTRKIIKQ